MARKMDTETAQAVAAKRKRVTVICVECKKSIEGVTARRRYQRRYCDRCRERLKKQRQRARAKAN